ncbi:hypothetical protein VPH35_068121 [Triticum aestivum]
MSVTAASMDVVFLAGGAAVELQHLRYFALWSPGENLSSGSPGRMMVLCLRQHYLLGGVILETLKRRLLLLRVVDGGAAILGPMVVSSSSCVSLRLSFVWSPCACSRPSHGCRCAAASFGLLVLSWFTFAQ